MKRNWHDLLQDKDGADYFLQCERKELANLKRDLEETLRVTINQLQVNQPHCTSAPVLRNRKPPPTPDAVSVSLSGPGSEQQAAAGVCQREGPGAGAAASNRICWRSAQRSSRQSSGADQPLHTRYAAEKLRARAGQTWFCIRLRSSLGQM